MKNSFYCRTAMARAPCGAGDDPAVKTALITEIAFLCGRDPSVPLTGFIWSDCWSPAGSWDEGSTLSQAQM